MKSIIILVLFQIGTLTSTFLTAQTKSIAGNYELRYEMSNGLIIDKLSLNADGTFEFHEFQNLEERLTPESNTYAKGSWKVVNNNVYFSSSEKDLDEKYSLNFNNSKARFISKSPRDKSDRIIKTSIKFYKSEIPWIIGRTLVKVE